MIAVSGMVSGFPGSYVFYLRSSLFMCLFDTLYIPGQLYFHLMYIPLPEMLLRISFVGTSAILVLKRRGCFKSAEEHSFLHPALSPRSKLLPIDEDCNYPYHSEQNVSVYDGRPINQGQRRNGLSITSTSSDVCNSRDDRAIVDPKSTLNYSFEAKYLKGDIKLSSRSRYLPRSAL